MICPLNIRDHYVLAKTTKPEKWKYCIVGSSGFLRLESNHYLRIWNYMPGAKYKTAAAARQGAEAQTYFLHRGWKFKVMPLRIAENA